MPTAPTKTKKRFLKKSGELVINSAAWRRKEYEDAVENLIYWTCRAANATSAKDRADARVRAALWKTTRDARRVWVEALTQTPAN